MDQVRTYTNLRREATFTDWPTGSYRTECRFTVETDKKRGERVARITQHPVRKTWNAPKKTTYGMIARIADGDDGRTYVLMFHNCGFITVKQSDLQFDAEHIHERDPRFVELVNEMKKGL